MPTSYKMDYKKEYKDLYMPKTEPAKILVPRMNFIIVEGEGDPNAEHGEYSRAIEILYALAYAIKMSPKAGKEIAGYFEYVVPPLEGLWWNKDDSYEDFTQKDKFRWVSMLRQPEFVTKGVFAWAQEAVRRKKPELDLQKAKLWEYEEGLCVQCMHIGSYDNEAASIEKINAFIAQNDLVLDISSASVDGDIKRHHEIYLSDPRKCAIEKLKTVIRHPVREKD